MNTALLFLIAGIATWRVSFFIARENGPGNIVVKLRSVLEPYFSIDCIKCVSVWVSIPFSFFVGGSFTELIVIWLALSGVAALIDEFTKAPFEWQEAESYGMLQKNSDSDND